MALKWAADEARRRGSTLRVLDAHVGEPGGARLVRPEMADRSPAQAVVRRLRPGGDPSPLGGGPRRGRRRPPAWSSRRPSPTADLLVVGARGRGGVRRASPRSVRRASDIQHAHCPVVVVLEGPQADDTPLGTGSLIVVGLDGPSDRHGRSGGWPSRRRRPGRHPGRGRLCMAVPADRLVRVGPGPGIRDGGTRDPARPPPSTGPSGPRTSRSWPSPVSGPPFPRCSMPPKVRGCWWWDPGATVGSPTCCSDRSPAVRAPCQVPGRRRAPGHDGGSRAARRRLRTGGRAGRPSSQWGLRRHEPDPGPERAPPPRRGVSGPKRARRIVGTPEPSPDRP